MSDNAAYERCVDLHAYAPGHIDRLPFTFRILLACALHEGRENDAKALLDWLQDRRSEAEILFRPRRILMHDTTAMPALVDLAAMRDVVSETGGDPGIVNPVCPVAVSIDHSLSVARYGSRGAMMYNVRREIDLNRERYGFLKWADSVFDALEVFPPGYGILHTINLEHLATITSVASDKEGNKHLVPDTIIGTDSHTPMINAIGVLGWGAGGLEAESAMLGQPMPLALPDVVGVRLLGSLPEGVLGTDLALYITQQLRRLGVVGQFVEFFGPGLASLGVGARAAVANMAPEYGATTGFFPIDDAVLSYLRSTGRSERQISRVALYAHRTGLWSRGTDQPQYSRQIDIDLNAIRPSVSGPRRPQDRRSLDEIAFTDHSPSSRTVPDGAIAIAAITSCTNTADLSMLAAAALLARKATERGLKIPGWVKTSFAPGSMAMLNALRKGGLMGALEQAGFSPVGIGCTTCIGNSGPLVPDMECALDENPDMTRFAVLSGNRNFAGRIHSSIMDAYLMSPPLVVAYAFAGRLANLEEDGLGIGEDGLPVKLADVWPSSIEIDGAVAQASAAENTLAAYRDKSGPQAWADIAAPGSNRFKWNPNSAYIQKPPFVTRMAGKWQAGSRTLAAVAVYGDDVTTDAISPAGTVPLSSEAGAYLRRLGIAERDFNVYAAFRGNFKIMLRGAFTAPALKNLLCPKMPPGMTVLNRDDSACTLKNAADIIAGQGQMPVILAGERYGQGSSRDWAAKAPALIGIRAILSSSFERIHRTNLIGMGIAPIQLPGHWHPHFLDMQAGDTIDAEFPNCPAIRVPISLRHMRDGECLGTGQAILACYTSLEAELLAAGGIFPHTINRLLGADVDETSKGAVV